MHTHCFVTSKKPKAKQQLTSSPPHTCASSLIPASRQPQRSAPLCQRPALPPQVKRRPVAPPPPKTELPAPVEPAQQQLQHAQPRPLAQRPPPQPKSLWVRARGPPCSHHSGGWIATICFFFNSSSCVCARLRLSLQDRRQTRRGEEGRCREDVRRYDRAAPRLPSHLSTHFYYLE